jgi:hypothetical protein
VIVRIATEGQYELDPGGSSALDELEAQALQACQSDDEAAFRSAFDRLLDLVRTQGKPVPDDQLVGSDVILPPPDVSLEEAKAEFTGEGLIPG